jgi:hypothetical protein
VEAEEEKEGEGGEDWDNKEVNEDGERIEDDEVVKEDTGKGNDDEAEGDEEDFKEVN